MSDVRTFDDRMQMQMQRLMAKLIFLLVVGASNAGISALLVSGAMAQTNHQTQAVSTVNPTLDAIFSDRLVLQRDTPIRVWGEARPEERVGISLGTTVTTVTASTTGRWEAQLPAKPAGGPYQLEVVTAAGLSETANDVLIGDVYLCSGQSNMEWPVRETTDANSARVTSPHPRIRLLTVPRSSQASPRVSLDEATGWQVAGATTTPSFSATCYYFAEALQRHVNVPIGLISSSWGGSRLEVWLSLAESTSLPSLQERAALLSLYQNDKRAAYARFDRQFRDWWSHHGPAPWDARFSESGNWQPIPLPLRNWKNWGNPETSQFDGLIWFRKSLTLNEAEASALSRISLGEIDEIDHVWVNGVLIGQSFGWGNLRTYDIPQGILKAGENQIVVAVASYWDMAGMLGPASSVAVTNADQTLRLSLSDGWVWQKSGKSISDLPRSPWDSINGISVLNNGMIAPLGRFGLKGVVWYQGESNAADPDNYSVLLSRLMADWRRQFSPTLPFLIVQLPEFGTVTGQVEENSSWARIREQQRLGVNRDGNAALAVTMGLGDPADIHPRNKQPVGERLAIAARALIYRQTGSSSGPRPASVTRQGRFIELQWSDLTGRLRSRSPRTITGFEVCTSQVGTCQRISAQITGLKQVTLGPIAAELVGSASRVRYCWGDAPRCDLQDSANLPAMPFEEMVR